MNILSPYGKDVASELRHFYGLASLEAAAAFVERYLREQYGFQTVVVEALHVAYGLAAFVRADGDGYVLKVASRSMHDNPEQLFPWLTFLREHAIPIPEVLPLRDGAAFAAPLISTDDVVYLMRVVPGAPAQRITLAVVEQYAEAMARFHALGRSYPHAVRGSLATSVGKWEERDALAQELRGSPLIDPAFVDLALAAVEQLAPVPLATTIIHGDFRLCHVFFAGEQLSGIIDVDQSTTGEAWVDLCYGLLSGTTPQAGSALDLADVRRALAVYNRRLPLGPADRAALRATFALAALETLRDLLPGVVAGSAAPRELERTQRLAADLLVLAPDALFDEAHS